MEAYYRDIDVINQIDISTFPKNQITYKWLHLVSNGIGQPIYIPIIVAKGNSEGKVVGLTAGVHGNELNGISVIQKLFNSIELDKLNGTIVGVPIMNVPSILLNERRFIDGVDLNRIMPGKVKGNRSELYAFRFVNKIVKHFDYLMDLHTASFGRINSFYIRADLSSSIASKLAELQNAQIILDVPPKDGTLRGAASDMGIDAITIEIGDPDRFQKNLIKLGLSGVYNTLAHLNIYDTKIELSEEPAIVCKTSYWIYTNRGGILQVHAQLTQKVTKGDLIATIRDVFGQIIKEYFAPEDGIIIGKSTNPIGQSGSRIVHLGILK